MTSPPPSTCASCSCRTTGAVCGTGGGGGCVAQGTPILTDHGYVPVQSLKSGDVLMTYDLQTGQLVNVHVLSITMTWDSSLVSINNGALLLTSTDQPIYLQNSSYTGWERNPQNLKVGDSIFDPMHNQWVRVFSVQPIHDNTKVYDIVEDGPKTFIANGYLTLDK